MIPRRTPIATAAVRSLAPSFSMMCLTWYGLVSSTNYTTSIHVFWGGDGFTPVKGDYDGDGKADIATYRESTGVWNILLSGANYTTSLTKNLGGTGYVPVPKHP